MTAPAVALLHRTFPCCGRRARFIADVDEYQRTCPNCLDSERRPLRWTVRRVTRPASAFSERMGTRFDALEWERVVR